MNGENEKASGEKNKIDVRQGPERRLNDSQNKQLQSLLDQLKIHYGVDGKDETKTTRRRSSFAR